jgi:hypothetical protein
MYKKCFENSYAYLELRSVHAINQLQQNFLPHKIPFVRRLFNKLHSEFQRIKRARNHIYVDTNSPPSPLNLHGNLLRAVVKNWLAAIRPNGSQRLWISTPAIVSASYNCTPELFTPIHDPAFASALLNTIVSIQRCGGAQKVISGPQRLQRDFLSQTRHLNSWL